MKISKQQLEALINEAVEKTLVMKEADDGGKFLEFDLIQAVKNMLRRAQTEDEMIEIAEAYDIILELLPHANSPEINGHVQKHLKQPYAKILFRKAVKQAADGKLDLATPPSGTTLLVQAVDAKGAEKESRAALQRKDQEREAARRASMSPEQRSSEDSEKELASVYGGDRRNMNRGLGT